MKKLILTTIAACTLLNSASLAHPTSPSEPPTEIPPQRPEPMVEVLKGFTFDRDGITIQVTSNGCTTKRSFEILVAESFPAQVQFNRLVPDACRALFPYGTKLTYTYEELGLDSKNSFHLVNQIDPGLLPKH